MSDVAEKPKADKGDKPDAAEKTRGTLVTDPEIVAMSKVATILDDLPPPVRDLVLTYFTYRYRSAVVREQQACCGVPAP